jgi:hypothetical protein
MGTGLRDAGTPPAWRARVRGGAGDPANLSEDSYRLSVLLLTFVCYALFHCNRKACALPPTRPTRTAPLRPCVARVHVRSPQRSHQSTAARETLPPAGELHPPVSQGTRRAKCSATEGSSKPFGRPTAVAIRRAQSSRVSRRQLRAASGRPCACCGSASPPTVCACSTLDPA